MNKSNRTSKYTDVFFNGEREDVGDSMIMMSNVFITNDSEGEPIVKGTDVNGNTMRFYVFGVKVIIGSVTMTEFTKWEGK